ncbi:thiol-disulfide oxidoreductase DCC family protein [Bacteroidota bacterium]
MERTETESEIVLFDGYCNFCTGWVLFIIRRDRKKNFKFAASQTPAGAKLLLEFGIQELASHSIVLINNGIIFSKSTAALRIAKKLTGIWPVLYSLIILPRFFRDYFYELIARNRYRIYGKRDDCFLPGPQIRDRFFELNQIDSSG